MKEKYSYLYNDNSPNSVNLLGENTFKIGDLVSTIMGDYGIVVGFESVSISPTTAKEDYCKILMKDNHVYHYVFSSLKKIQKKLDK